MSDRFSLEEEARWHEVVDAPAERRHLRAVEGPRTDGETGHAHASEHG